MEKEMQKSLLLLTFSITESDPNVPSIMHQLFKTHDELLEHIETFQTLETIEMQDIHDSVDKVCIKKFQSNIWRTRSK